MSLPLFSAGVGRTGTFIALDNLYHQAMTEECLRPLQMVETLRRQRVNMVQTKVIFETARRQFWPILVL